MEFVRLEHLPQIELGIWAELAHAPRLKSHPWRIGVLATADAGRGDGRSIVLRDVDLEKRSLLFYADSRSPKVEQLQRHPLGTIVLWWPERGWQLRLRVSLSMETSGLAVSSRWARLKMTPAAHDYLSPLPPGSRLEQPLPERGTREFFGVVTATVSAIDWLELHAGGHRRAAFDAEGPRWLVP
jgi:hypothetical protein